MDFRQLRSFIAVATAGSFSQAAKDQHIAQPALSRQIAQLEDELGVELLVRHGRGVALTAQGIRLLERAEVISHYLAETAHIVKDNAIQETGHLAIGLTPAIGQMIGPKLIAGFHKRWPNASLHAREGLSTSLQGWLLEGSVQVAVVYNQTPLDAFEITPLFSEPMVLVGPPGEDERTYRLSAIAHLPLILPALPHSNRRLIEQAALQSGLRLNVVVEVDSVALTKQLVRDRMGYSILAYAAVQQDRRERRVAIHMIERPALKSIVSVATSRGQHATALSKDWIERLKEDVAALVKEGDWKEVATWLDSG